MVDEIKLLDMKVDNLDKKTLKIIDDLNNRLNRLEDKINESDKESNIPPTDNSYPEDTIVEHYLNR